MEEGQEEAEEEKIENDRNPYPMYARGNPPGWEEKETETVKS
jgi:hypothetical protein